MKLRWRCVLLNKNIEVTTTDKLTVDEGPELIGSNIGLKLRIRHR